MEESPDAVDEASDDARWLVVRTAGDEDATAAARRRVQLAKVGLGERGTPWWEQDQAARRARLERALEELDALDEQS